MTNSGLADERGQSPLEHGDGGPAPREAPQSAGNTSAGHGKEPRRTRLSSVWFGLAVLIVLGVALVDFIVQNTRSVRIEFFTASGRIPVAVALLAAALAGALVVLVAGISRTAQLRLAIRRQRRSTDERVAHGGAAASEARATEPPEGGPRTN